MGRGTSKGADAFTARTDAVRRFHADELLNRDEGVALLCVTVTANGIVRTLALGLDAVHAQIVLGELDRIRPMLVEHIEKHRCKVIPLRR